MSLNHDSASRSIVSTSAMSRDFIQDVIADANRAKAASAGGSTLGERCLGKIVSTQFYESSLRTKLSFESAALRLGASVLGGAAGETARSNSAFYESIKDSARLFSGYADVIVVRHSSTSAIQQYLAHATVPVINAGSGQGPGSEHPTQALVDLYTIYDELGRLDGLTILLMGSLMKRAARSFATAVACFSGVQLLLYTLAEFSFSTAEIAELESSGVSVRQVANLETAIAQAHVIYHAGLTNEAQTQMPEEFTLTARALSGCLREAVVLHPMPRLGSISVDVDCLPQAKYLENARNGVFVRMALLSRSLGVGLT